MIITPTSILQCDLSSLVINADAAFEQLGAQAGDLLGVRERFVMRGALSKAKSLIAPRGAWRAFAVCRDEATGEYILPEAQLRIPGRMIASAFGDISHMVLMAVTIGPKLEQFATAVGAGGDVAGQVLLDAIASVAVEEAADMLSDRLREWVIPHALYASQRYSPGYGDVPLTMQSDFRRLLEMETTLGICVEHGEVLHPYKSITAFVGLRASSYGFGKQFNCLDCNLKGKCKQRHCRK